MARIPIGLRGGLGELVAHIAQVAAFSDTEVEFNSATYRDLFLAGFDTIVADIAALDAKPTLSPAQIAQNEREALVSDILSAAHTAATGAA